MKEYVLVSQGIEIYRTTDKIEAEMMMKIGLNMFNNASMMV